jgi:cysteinyl-tRNA synthetase
VRYWLHCAHLMVEGQKMSKSAGNFFTLRDLTPKGWSGREIRYALLSVNYRLPLNFTFDGLAAARSALGRIDEWVARLTDCASAQSAASPLPLAGHTGFADALDDDLNISGALGQLFDVIREANRAFDAGQISPADARALLVWWEGVNSVLQFQRDEEAVPAAVLALLEKRTAARAAKNFALSDELRNELDAAGWLVKDTKDGQKLTKK